MKSQLTGGRKTLQNIYIIKFWHSKHTKTLKMQKYDIQQNTIHLKKKNEIMSFATWMDLQNIILNEVRNRKINTI